MLSKEELEDELDPLLIEYWKADTAQKEHAILRMLEIAWKKGYDCGLADGRAAEATS